MDSYSLFPDNFIIHSTYSQPRSVVGNASTRLDMSLLTAAQIATLSASGSPRSQSTPTSAHQDPASPQKRVPRPRNAFMIFRSAFWAEAKIARTVEHDHRHISRIIGHCWNKMSEVDKDVWRRKAELEKAEHGIKHPGYRFCPTARTKKPIKRNVKRNGVKDLLRCEQLADLLLAGKQGYELEKADRKLKCPSTERPKGDDGPSLLGSQVSSFPSCTQDPPFRSPLLPPLSLEDDSTSPSSSPEVSPAGEFFAYDFFLQGSPFRPPKTVENSISNYSSVANHLSFEPEPVHSLTYSAPHSQISDSLQGFELELESAQNSGHTSYAAASYPLSTLSTGRLYSAFGVCEPEVNSVQPLPGPMSDASIRAEPIQWNNAFTFATY
ncbi:hypothetical protein FA15DRAFT_713179 [Coprinopsis marcescibilis]|uniref:HMG box domain-containing protein n=1 Tax=Coprinopsis marcescibilis TaxID=230819 RepID=A0A5C3LDE9_COPMA|nr:hypothetical protein FA15DRAFT_713179 [Coprinopsis marcescibilis]